MTPNEKARREPGLCCGSVRYALGDRRGQSNRSDDQQPDSELPSPPTAFDPFDLLAVFRGKLVPLREPGAQQFSDVKLEEREKNPPCWSVVVPSRRSRADAAAIQQQDRSRVEQ